MREFLITNEAEAEALIALGESWTGEVELDGKVQTITLNISDIYKEWNEHGEGGPSRLHKRSIGLTDQLVRAVVENRDWDRSHLERLFLDRLKNHEGKPFGEDEPTIFLDMGTNKDGIPVMTLLDGVHRLLLNSILQAENVYAIILPLSEIDRFRLKIRIRLPGSDRIVDMDDPAVAKSGWGSYGKPGDNPRWGTGG